MSPFRSLLLALSIAALAACNGGTTPNDAGDQPDVSHDAPPQDTGCAVPDAGPSVPSPFGACTADTDCLSGWSCRTNTQGYPGGWCTKTCATNNDCLVDSVAFPGINTACGVDGSDHVCQLVCLNGYDCGRAGYTCVDMKPVRPGSMDMTGVCAPSCDLGNCGAGTSCNRWTGRCQAPEVPPDPTSDAGACTPGPAPAPAGADNGEACASNADCRSNQCNTATTTSGTYTGWNGGSCLSTCALSVGWNISTVWPTDYFPQSNCPPNNVCFPAGNDEAAGDEGVCIRSCMADSDCRVSEGYYCLKTFNRNRDRPHTWQNGICRPVDCLNDSSHPCPTGYVCESHTTSNGTTGVCRPAGATDGGTDAATDAAADVTQSDASTDDASADAGSDGATKTDGGLDVATD